MTTDTLDAVVASSEKLSFRLAAWLLLKKQQVTFTELEALPTVKDEKDVQAIIDYLTTHFDAEKSTQKVASWPMLSWETIVKLNSTK
jgi:hypothetical protein